MKEEISGQKEKRKILVEFTVPDGWERGHEPTYFSDLADYNGEFSVLESEFFNSAKVVTPCESADSGPLDTLP